MDPNSSTDGSNMAPVAREAEVEDSEMVAVPGGPEGGIEEEEDMQALTGSPEDGDTEEDSDIGPAEEEAGELAVSQDLMVDARQFPMVGFRFMFLNLIHSFLNRVYYNDHILVRAYHGGLVQIRSPGLDGSGELPLLQLPQRPRVTAVSSEGEGEGLGLGPRAATTSVLEPQDPADRAAARDAPEMEESAAGSAEDREQAADEGERPRHQHDNWSEDDKDFEGGEETETEEEDTENQEQEEGPEKNLDTADSSSRKPSWKE